MPTPVAGLPLDFLVADKSEFMQPIMSDRRGACNTSPILTRPDPLEIAMQARSAHTTRRALVAAAVMMPGSAMAAAVVPALPSTDAIHDPADRRTFIEQIAALHPNGRLVATTAMAMDLDPARLREVRLSRAEGRDLEPALVFSQSGRSGHLVLVSPREAPEWAQQL